MRETLSGNRLEDKAFGFLHIPVRATKPRTTGLTILSDKDFGMHQVEDILQTSADYLDWVKISSCSGRLLDEATIMAKIKAYHDADVEILLTGEVFELGVNQGVMDQVFAKAAEYGFDGVEIATAQVIMAVEAKAELVTLAAKHGLKVFAEVGKKGLENVGAAVSWMNREIDIMFEAGATFVLVQAEGIIEDVETVDESTLYSIAAKHGIERLVFQAKDSRSKLWFIENLGPRVNLDIDPGQVLSMEVARRGLAKRGLFGLVSDV